MEEYKFKTRDDLSMHFADAWLHIWQGDLMYSIARDDIKLTMEHDRSCGELEDWCTEMSLTTPGSIVIVSFGYSEYKDVETFINTYKNNEVRKPLRSGYGVGLHAGELGEGFLPDHRNNKMKRLFKVNREYVFHKTQTGIDVHELRVGHTRESASANWCILKGLRQNEGHNLFMSPEERKHLAQLCYEVWSEVRPIDEKE